MLASAQHHPRRLTSIGLVVVAVAASAAALIWPASTFASTSGSTSLLKVQLKWLDQAQFAGYYVATDQGYFAKRGLVVRTMPGSAMLDPMQSLANGSADVAQASMDQAQRASVGGKRYVNIAQIFQDPGSLLICRIRRGFNSANDLHGARVIANAGRQDLVASTFAHIFPDGGKPVFIDPSGDDVQNLADGQADCLWGTTFNEYWRARDLGLNVFTVLPQDYGVVDIEDGLYVDESRLSSPEFRTQLVGLVEGLRDGWACADCSGAEPESGRVNPATTARIRSGSHRRQFRVPGPARVRVAESARAAVTGT
jgi:NitT/TauT family transport system substrate-binding protein